MIGKLTAALIAITIAIVMMAAFVPIVSAHAPSDYTSKYVATPANVGTPTGILRGQIACYHNLFSKEVLMTLQGTTQTTVLKVTDSGSFEANDVSPGVYDLVLTDGNGGQPETTIATIRAGQISFPERSFIGHAVSDLGAVRKPVTTITEATYGVGGSFVDVTGEVQAVVDSGVLSFKFRNDMNPGGIVSTDDVLLKAITDPALGQVKNVVIKYTIDGEPQTTINTQEYEVINL